MHICLSWLFIVGDRQFFFINRPQTKTEHNIFVDSVCVTNACMCYQAYRQHSLLNATVVVAANCHKQCTLVLPDSSCHGDDDQPSAHSTHARAHKANDKLLLLFTAVYLTVCIKTKICVLHTTTRTLSIADAHTVKQSKTTQFWQNDHYHGIIHCKLFFFSCLYPRYELVKWNLFVNDVCYWVFINRDIELRSGIVANKFHCSVNASIEQLSQFEWDTLIDFCC